MTDRYDRFTDRARRAMQIAGEMAVYMRHEYVGTEHVLLGVIKAEGVASEALLNLGVSYDLVVEETDKRVAAGEHNPFGKVPMTPRVKDAVTAAMDVARSMRCHYVGSEHLLLALAQQDGGVAFDVLTAIGVGPAAIREEVTALLRRSPDTVEIRAEPGKFVHGERLEQLKQAAYAVVSKHDDGLLAPTANDSAAIEALKEALLNV